MIATSYQVEWANSLNDLTIKVNGQIKGGWQPIGGVSTSIAYDTGGNAINQVFFQAMIKPK
jgi:hypothetical protein